jgi:hypothetical protein
MEVANIRVRSTTTDRDARVSSFRKGTDHYVFATVSSRIPERAISRLRVRFRWFQLTSSVCEVLNSSNTVGSVGGRVCVPVPAPLPTGGRADPCCTWSTRYTDPGDYTIAVQAYTLPGPDPHYPIPTCAGSPPTLAGSPRNLACSNTVVVTPSSTPPPRARYPQVRPTTVEDVAGRVLLEKTQPTYSVGFSVMNAGPDPIRARLTVSRIEEPGDEGDRMLMRSLPPGRFQSRSFGLMHGSPTGMVDDSDAPVELDVDVPPTALTPVTFWFAAGDEDGREPRAQVFRIAEYRGDRFIGDITVVGLTHDVPLVDADEPPPDPSPVTLIGRPTLRPLPWLSPELGRWSLRWAREQATRMLPTMSGRWPAGPMPRFRLSARVTNPTDADLSDVSVAVESINTPDEDGFEDDFDVSVNPVAVKLGVLGSRATATAHWILDVKGDILPDIEVYLSTRDREHDDDNRLIVEPAHPLPRPPLI